MPQAHGLTRHQILTAIKVNGTMTAEMLGRELGISPVAVRQHLATLQAEGAVEATVQRRPLGRPVHLYSITPLGDESFPRRYDVLVNSLLGELRAAHGEAAVDELFAARCRRLRDAYADRLEGKPLAERVVEFARIQSGNGYMAEVRDDPPGYLLIERNCTICQVARSFPVACAHEIALIRQCLGEGVVVSRMSHMVDGDSACVYRIAPRHDGADSAR